MKIVILIILIASLGSCTNNTRAVVEQQRHSLHALRNALAEVRAAQDKLNAGGQEYTEAK